VEVEGHFYFDPFLMPEDRKCQGVTLWRVFRFPFVPFSGLEWTQSESASPDGFFLDQIKLNRVVWQHMFNYFTASTEPIVIFELDAMPMILAALLHAGWTTQQWNDARPLPAPKHPERIRGCSFRNHEWPGGTLEHWGEDRAVLKKDSKACRELKESIARTVCCYGDKSIAYAIDRTGLLLGDHSSDANEPAQWNAWMNARRAYREMSKEAADRWAQQVVTNYPDLFQLARDTLGQMKKVGKQSRSHRGQSRGRQSKEAVNR